MAARAAEPASPRHRGIKVHGGRRNERAGTNVTYEEPDPEGAPNSSYLRPSEPDCPAVFAGADNP